VTDALQTKLLSRWSLGIQLKPVNTHRQLPTGSLLRSLLRRCRTRQNTSSSLTAKDHNRCGSYHAKFPCLRLVCSYPLSLCKPSPATLLKLWRAQPPDHNLEHQSTTCPRVQVRLPIRKLRLLSTTFLTTLRLLMLFARRCVDFRMERELISGSLRRSIKPGGR